MFAPFESGPLRDTASRLRSISVTFPFALFVQAFCDLFWEPFQLQRECVCVCVSTRKWDCSSLFCFVQTNKICISSVLFGAPLIDTCACFYEHSPKRSLVNLSEIISKAAGVIDCSSDGRKKSGSVDQTLTSHSLIFHLSPCYQSCFWELDSVRTD